MYHALWPAAEDAATRERRFASDPQLCDPGARLYAFSDETLAFHMQAIQAEGYAPIDRWQQLAEPLTGRRILITFDDGHLSNFTIALPVLKAHGLRAAFFITTDWIGSHGFMNEAQICQLRDSGMLIGAHGCSHRYLAALSREEALEEMVRSRQRLGRYPWRAAPRRCHCREAGETVRCATWPARQVINTCSLRGSAWQRPTATRWIGRECQ